MAASSTSSVNELRFGGANYVPTAKFGLFIKAVEIAKVKNIAITAGNVLSSDEFYEDDNKSYKNGQNFECAVLRWKLPDFIRLRPSTMLML
jgi:purine-nucleoside phosphorylase